MFKEVIIIGAGPAGLMAGNILKKHNIPFLILDKNPLPGKKLLITGSGRCNVTNNRSLKEFINDLTIKHGKFLYSTLSSFGSKDVVNYFTNNHVNLVLENNLKYFPSSNKSKDILNVLTSNISKEIYLNEEVLSIEKSDDFTIKTSKKNYMAKNIIVATGSMSYPQTGSTGSGLKFAKYFDINYSDFYPAETSVYVKEIENNKEELQGLAFQQSNVKLIGEKHNYTGDIMFTHTGLSGPAIQHLSEFVYFSLKKGPSKIMFNITTKNKEDVEQELNKEKNGQIFVLQLLNKLTIKRMAKYLLKRSEIDNKKLNELSKKQINKLIRDLLHFEVEVLKVNDLEKAYVNGGGISVKELNPKSFMSNKIDGLYFIGETVDVHGPIGGYNITIALSSGYSAALDIVKRNK